MICGDDTGLCKRLSDVDGRVVVRWGEQAAGAAVHRLTLRGSTLACGRANGSVDLYELVDDDAALPPGRSRSDSRKGRMGIAGLAFASDDRLVVADEAGAIDVLDCARGLARVGEARASGGSDGLHTAQLRVDGAGALAATGGRDHELRIWDLVTMEVSWKARNVPEDMTRLAVPVWHTDLSFSPASSAIVVTVSGLYEQRLVGEVRLYDVRAQRRPVMRAIAPAGPLALSALALGPDGYTAYVGSATGDVSQLDLRRDGALVGGFKGAGGAVVAIELNADGSRLCTASFDRHVRVHSTASRKLLVGAYVKQRQRALVLLRGAFASTLAAGEGEEDEEGEGAGTKEDRRALARRERIEAAAADTDAVENLLGTLARVRDTDDGVVHVDTGAGTSGKKRAPKRDDDDASAAKQSAKPKKKAAK